ncbi:MAG TPA: helix-turn-helix domain-containing protein [Roseiflexaceae bacterium]|nr:helix-turn-helix domain-containing protein [Roseiflexaceae bacterium]HMP39080.1 helix-turn-helix domain-containing protein [Roseiflexaceae bacterium]
MSEMDLPRLSSAELASRFGGDEAALRRYRMLVALLRERRAVGDVARAFGVSRESIRRVRERFARGGLAALRSRRRGGGHLAQGTPLAVALRRELAEHPGSSPAQLWQYVQARLAAEGHAAPRSTFYRLLARLRDDESVTAPGAPPLRILRDALDIALEDPPTDLGRSELALRMLPNDPDPLGRGQRVQQALHTAIERLRPAGDAGPVLNDPRWRHYLILAGEYQVGDERTDLEEALALSTSTYSRAKREALERIGRLLPGILDELPPPPPPVGRIAPPAALPAAIDEPAVELYMAGMRRYGLVLMHGDDDATLRMAAMLADRLKQRGQKLIWHAARDHDRQRAGVELLRTLAAALAIEGERELWQTLAAPDAIVEVWHLDLLANLLAGRRWSIVIADHHLLTDGDAFQVLDVLTAGVEQRDLRLVLAGRSLPSWADAGRWPALPQDDDPARRNEFLTRLAARPATPPAADLSPLGVVRDHVAILIASLPTTSARSLPPAEAAQLLVELAPLTAIFEALREAARNTGS